PATGSAGIGTNAPNASSLLEMVSTSKGLLIPRMTVAQRNAIATPATGLMIYQTNNTPGFYYYTGAAWTALTPKSKGWALTGNAGTSPAANFIGTTDAQPLLFKVNNQLSASLDFSSAANTSFGYKTLASNTNFNNSAFGYQSLFSNTTGGYNTAVGTYSLLNNTLGYQNTAIGSSSLQSNQSGNYNAALGYGALLNNTTGSSNVAIGNTALQQNISGSGNIAIGDVALYNNTTTNENIAIGNYSLYANTTGTANTALGHYSLQANTTGSNNTANGNSALYANTTGRDNSAFGSGALASNNGSNADANSAFGAASLEFNTSGAGNSAMGYGAMESNTIGGNNTSVGYGSMEYNTGGSENVGVGVRALNNNISGNQNTALGVYANTNLIVNLNNATAIGYYAQVDASNKVRIGNTYVNSIGGQVGWTNFSDGRIKKEIKENVPGLSFIKALRPVTYHFDLAKENALMGMKDSINYPGKYDIEKTAFTGFVAQEVDEAAKKMNYDFSGVDKSGKIWGLRYAEFVVPLTKAVQELSKMNDDKEAQINEQNKKIDNLQQQIDALKLLLQNKQSFNNATTASLEQNTPNPFNQSTNINYTLPEKFSSAKMIVTDNAGKTVKQFTLSSAGKGAVSIAAGSLAAGTYYYSLYIDNKKIESKKMEIIK
ncbi:MAG TPA: tail fiber domain-containing protein, partial [Panacibacter sp.]|nr:tail fiber domain-containing protein [Panacibacter sp.]